MPIYRWVPDPTIARPSTAPAASAAAAPAAAIAPAVHRPRGGIDRGVGSTRQHDGAGERHGEKEFLIERRARRPRMGGLIRLQNVFAGPRPRGTRRQDDAGDRCED